MKCINRIELVFSMLWLSAIFFVPWLVASEAAFWKATAITATVVAFFHGIVFWVAYWRQRSFRETIIMDVREVLKDDVNNKLTVISMMLQQHAQTHEDGADLEDANKLVKEISQQLNTLTTKTVVEWKRKYAGNGDTE